MVRWLRWHCPPDTGFEIRALVVGGRARYLSVTEAPHNTDFHTWMGKKHFCFFQTAETGNRIPNSGVKGSVAYHFPCSSGFGPYCASGAHEQIPVASGGGLIRPGINHHFARWRVVVLYSLIRQPKSHLSVDGKTQWLTILNVMSKQIEKNNQPDWIGLKLPYA